MLTNSLALLLLFFGSGLTSDELNMLQDPGGWEYLTISDADAGIQTQHVCFDGRPHPGACSGTLILSARKTFVKSIHIHGQAVDRHGNYRLDGNQIAFFDEFGTEDGPYTIELNAETKRLVLSMPQVRMELELESQYREDSRSQKKKPK